ncbi:MAG: Pyridoxine 5'-phosphate oxidase, Rv1155, partial [uncultured Friedmanniella sp.]
GDQRSSGRRPDLPRVDPDHAAAQRPPAAVERAAHRGRRGDRARLDHRRPSQVRQPATGALGGAQVRRRLVLVLRGAGGTGRAVRGRGRSRRRRRRGAGGDLPCPLRRARRLGRLPGGHGGGPPGGRPAPAGPRLRAAAL